ncbi:hypothetical protein IHE55_13725 [Streptomyces pactum]|uniref:Uncharacterized protein n=1 Tax=Streptomyces pactum TaxID=68249 RepID=A0ABS0NKS4_9ACTN|nr:hypothetical protein [Streptomyces pactum]MBH5335796.1 hypothetical protein [Streptomyces pactum]
MTSHIDRLLARALVAATPPTDIPAAEARIAARLSAGRAQGRRGGCEDGAAPAAVPPLAAGQGAAPTAPYDVLRTRQPSRPSPGGHRLDGGGRHPGDDEDPRQRPHGAGPAEHTGRRAAAGRMAGDLHTLCEAVIARPGALTLLGDLVARRILEPPGARVLGCVLRLAEHPDCAQFWWQFAAGAGDPAAAYCLYLHHMALGEEAQAHGWLNWWHEEACTQAPPVVDPLHEDAPTDHEMAIALRVLRGFTKGRDLPAPVRAVLAYVPRAVDYRDDLELDLPLPEPGFAARIEHLTASALVPPGTGTHRPDRELLPERRACHRPPAPRSDVEVSWDWRSLITV